MTLEHATGQLQTVREPVSVSEAGGDRDTPQLGVVRAEWLEQFISSVTVLLRGPVSPKKFLGEPYFRDCWIDQRFPKVAFVTAIACQALLVVFPPPIWKIQPSRSEVLTSHMELTWYGPVKDFPAILPAGRPPKAVPQQKEASKALPRPVAEAFHPRQTIISAPLHPTHPRQTLIQPSAPPEPPKILPVLPNLVELSIARPARPKLQLTLAQLAAMRPKARASAAIRDTAAPEVSMAEKPLGAINIASSTQAPPKPVLRVSPMSAPRTAPQMGGANAAAPDIAQGTDSRTLIALSATPAPVAPPPGIPAGNLSARVSISPEGPQPGVPGRPAEGATSTGGAVGGGGHGPEGIFISGGNSANASPPSGPGIGSASRGAGIPLPSRPVPRVKAIAGDWKASASPTDSGPGTDGPKLGVPPEDVLGAKRVYTLHINMPNLTSASGSWVLNFAELNEMDAGLYSKPATSELAGPVPVRKVDPKYPPEFRAAHVEGEVILYAVIRKDGTVDSIQLVHGVDPILDKNAMEALAQWKFRPAEKSGKPVDLEAVVHIPYRSRAPQL